MVLGYVAGAGGALLARTRRGRARRHDRRRDRGRAAGLALALDALIRGTASSSRSRVPRHGGRRQPRASTAWARSSSSLVGVVAVPRALLRLRLTPRAYEGRYSLRLLGAMLNLFLLALSLVPFADNVVTFLLIWEAMSLASYFLVLTESDGRRRSGPGTGTSP